MSKSDNKQYPRSGKTEKKMKFFVGTPRFDHSTPRLRISECLMYEVIKKLI